MEEGGVHTGYCIWLCLCQGMLYSSGRRTEWRLNGAAVEPSLTPAFVPLAAEFGVLLQRFTLGMNTLRT